MCDRTDDMTSPDNADVPTVMLGDVMTGEMRPHELFSDGHAAALHTHDPGGLFRYPRTILGLTIDEVRKAVAIADMTRPGWRGKGPVTEHGIAYAALNQVPPPTGLGEAEHVVRRYDVEAWSPYGPVASRTRRRVAVDHEPGGPRDFVDDLLETLEGSGWSVGIGDLRFTIHGQVGERVVDARTHRDA